MAMGDGVVMWGEKASVLGMRLSIRVRVEGSASDIVL